MPNHDKERRNGFIAIITGIIYTYALFALSNIMHTVALGLCTVIVSSLIYALLDYKDAYRELQKEYNVLKENSLSLGHAE